MGVRDSIWADERVRPLLALEGDRLVNLQAHMNCQQLQGLQGYPALQQSPVLEEVERPQLPIRQEIGNIDTSRHFSDFRVNQGFPSMS